MRSVAVLTAVKSHTNEARMKVLVNLTLSLMPLVSLALCKDQVLSLRHAHAAVSRCLLQALHGW